VAWHTAIIWLYPINGGSAFTLHD